MGFSIFTVSFRTAQKCGVNHCELKKKLHCCGPFAFALFRSGM